jgi:hypothetical protein
MKVRLFRICKNISFIVVLIVIFDSCSPEYVPNMVNSPMFNNKGEFQATMAAGNGNYDAQTAIAITDNLGIMVNGSYGNETSDSSDNFHKHLFFEGGFGYYDKIRDIWQYEIYGGYGYGRIEGYFANGFLTEMSSATYNRFFIQPGVGVSTGIYDGSFSPRIAIIQMNRTGENIKPGNYHVFFEPVITSKVGFKYVKFIFQFGFSFPFSENNMNFDHEPLIMGFGINLNLGRKYNF